MSVLVPNHILIARLTHDLLMVLLIVPVVANEGLSLVAVLSNTVAESPTIRVVLTVLVAAKGGAPVVSGVAAVAALAVRSRAAYGSPTLLSGRRTAYLLSRGRTLHLAPGGGLLHSRTGSGATDLLARSCSSHLLLWAAHEAVTPLTVLAALSRCRME